VDIVAQAGAAHLFDCRRGSPATGLTPATPSGTVRRHARRPSAVKRFRLSLGAWLSVVFACGVLREGYFYLIRESLLEGRPTVGAEFEGMRQFLAGVPRVGYLSDQPLDTDPTVARADGNGDLMYAAAQYALAPTILAHSRRDPALVVAFFTDAGRLDDALRNGSFEVVSRPFPNVALLRRK
jgi:hypothetical protein